MREQSEESEREGKFHEKEEKGLEKGRYKMGRI